MRALAMLVVAGCGFAPTASTQDIDASVDALQLLVDTPAGCTSYSTQFDSCAVGSGPNADLTLTGNTKYNTDTNTLTLDDNSTRHPPHVVINTATGSVDVLFVGGFTLTGTLRVTGTFPFGIAATGAVNIAGILDASNNGAGARSDTNCKTATSLGAGGDGNSGGGGGGGGGAFHGAGGGGGPGNSDGTTTAGGAAGAPTVRPNGLLGGCDGGKGGDGASGNTGGNAGDGGGAVLVATQSTVTVAGGSAIDVGGGGGHAGNANGGAGGGGASGGMILIECMSLHFAGAIVANGGGGGEGADSGNSGMDGANGTRTQARALGGFGNAPEGGDAADGGAGSTNDGVTATQFKKGGGGGGGGGTGYIAIKCGSIVDGGGTISPAYAAWP